MISDCYTANVITHHIYSAWQFHSITTFWVKRIDIKKSKLQSFHDFKQCCRFLQIPNLKPHVRHQWIYGMGTKRCYVDPRDSSNTMCCRMRKMRVQRASEHGLGPSTRTMDPLLKRSPIQNGCPSYIGAYVHTKCTSQKSRRARNSVAAYRGCVTHKPITACYLVFPDTSA